jgi:YD repeat-containing protein
VLDAFYHAPLLSQNPSSLRRNQTAITDTLGFVTHFTYDSARRLLTQADARGAVTTYAYNAGQLIATSDPLGRTAGSTYDILGRLTERTAPDGVVTAYEYDHANRLVAVTEHADTGEPADAQTNVRTSYTYDPNGNLLTITNPNGHVTHFAYDALNRRISSSDPLSNTQLLFYTPRGELDHAIDGLNRTTTYHYDLLGHTLAITRPDALVEYAYDALGRTSVMTDSVGDAAVLWRGAHVRQADGSCDAVWRG